MPPDALAVALRKLGIKCKAIDIIPEQAVPGQPNPADYPGFRPALVHFPGARWTWTAPR